MHVSGTTGTALIVGGAYAGIAAVNTMPKPGEKIDVGRIYQWFYDWAHMMLNSPMAARFESKYSLSPGGTLTETQTVTGTGTAVK